MRIVCFATVCCYEETNKQTKNRKNKIKKQTCRQEKLSYIALDYNKELKNPDSSDGLEKAYELPDGQVRDGAN